MSENPPANLIRAYVDGELSVEERASIERLIEEDVELHARVEFERAMRMRVGRVFEAEHSEAPLDVRERVAAVFNEPEPAATSAASQPAVTEATHGREPGRPRPDSVLAALRNLFGRPQHVSVAAVGGVVVLLVAVILVGILAPSIDQRGHVAADLVGDISEWIAQEHDRCAGDEDVLKNKLRTSCRHAAAMKLLDHLSVDQVTIFDLSDVGYEFIGEGRCGMPGSDSSAHLMYRRNVEGKSRALLSIFVMPNTGQFDELIEGGMEPGHWYEFKCRTKCSRVVRQCTDSTLAYFVVSCDLQDLPKISEAIGRSLIVMQP